MKALPVPLGFTNLAEVGGVVRCRCNCLIAHLPYSYEYGRFLMD